jgi:hypothetical protein
VTRAAVTAAPALRSLKAGAEIVLTNLCTASNKDCTWKWSKGQLTSDNTSKGTFSVNAVGGAKQLAALKLAKACTASNPDCVFSGLYAKP